MKGQKHLTLNINQIPRVVCPQCSLHLNSMFPFLTFSLERNIVSGHRFSAALFAAKADIEHFEQILSGFIWQVR